MNEDTRERYMPPPAPAPIDYRKILREYMRYVLECEGVTFVWAMSVTRPLTKEEFDALREVEKEVKDG